MRAVRGDLLILTAVLALPGVCGAQVAFPGVVERITGVREDTGVFVVGERPGARVECGDLELFGIAGLRVIGARARFPVRGASVGVEVCRVGAEVGAHARATASAGLAAGRWRCALRAGVESVALAGLPAESATVTGIVSGVEAGGVQLTADVESIGGAFGRVTLMTTAVSARLPGGVAVVASARFDGPGALAAGVAAVVPVHEALSLLAGYDDGTETLRAGARVRVGRCEVAAGMFRHAVLGVSRGVSVAAAW